MNSPFVNFKLKPGISRSLTGAALLLSTAALINAGESKANDVECFLSTISTCSALIGDKSFSGFSLTGFTARANDKVVISEDSGIWTVQTLFSPATSGTASVNGTLKYNIGIVGTPFTFKTARVDVNGINPIVGNPRVVSTITGDGNGLTGIGTPNVPLPLPQNTFMTDTFSGNNDKAFANNVKNITVSQNFIAGPNGRRLSAFTTEFTQEVPAPLPLLGAGAAFGFSRRLRSRIKTSAAV
jgi:hypothetical protein